MGTETVTLAPVRKTFGGHTGISQGGGFSFLAAVLSDIPMRAVVAEYPFLCNFPRAIDTALEGPDGEINEFLRRSGDRAVEEQLFRTLTYFDAMNFAPDIKASIAVAVGLVDPITPPSTIFAAFNHIGSTSIDLFVHRYFGREPMSRFQT